MVSEDYVVAELDAPAQVDIALAALREAGFADNALTVLCPGDMPEQVVRAEGRLGFLRRWLAGWDIIATDEAGAMRRYRAAAAQGRTTVTVHAPREADAKKAAQVLRAQGGHDIWYYRRWMTQEL